MNNIICIHSYKGGTGKTILSINIAYRLSENFKVLLIETDFLMPCFYQIFANSVIKYYYNDFYSSNNVLIRDCITKSSYNNLDLIFASPSYDPNAKIFSNDQKWHLKRLRNLLNQLSQIVPEYDFIIMDTAPGRNFVAISNLIIANLVLVVLRPTEYSVIGTKNMLEEIYKKTKPKTLLSAFIIINQVPLPESEEMRSKIRDWKTKLKATKQIKKFYSIPLCEKTAVENALGILILTKGEVQRIIGNIIGDIIDIQ